MPEEVQDNPVGRMSLLSHLQALRKVIMVSVIAVLVTSVAAYSFIDPLLAIVLKPANDAHIKLVYTGVTEGIFFKLHVSIVFGAIAASPILLWCRCIGDRFEPCGSLKLSWMG